MSLASSLPSLVVEDVPIDRLRPDPANPRRIGEDELDSLERSLRQFGFVQPVVARREDGIVIGGHQRLVAARRLGLTSVPVIWLDVSVEQARLLGLALNRISGSWDDALFARLLADLQATPDLDLTLSGFGDDEVRDLRAAQEARAIVEARYLDRHAALFPDDVKAWDEQVKRTGALADLGCRLAERLGDIQAAPADPDAVATRVTERVADLVEPTRSRIRPGPLRDEPIAATTGSAQLRPVGSRVGALGRLGA